VDENDRMIIDPQVSIPTSEEWLFRNKEALASVRRGLAEAAEGKATVIGSFAPFVDDDESGSVSTSDPGQSPGLGWRLRASTTLSPRAISVGG